jgi:type II secretory pathway predicted ATPase ExeA
MRNNLNGWFSIKFNPFSADIPNSCIWTQTEAGMFLRRLENLSVTGGFALITGEPGTGKSVFLRYAATELQKKGNIKVGFFSRPQSTMSDFYRELGDIFGLPVSACNRWCNFMTLRKNWIEHISTTLYRPVLIIDEAQIMKPPIFNEIRLLSSMEMDSKNALTVIFAGNRRLGEMLKTEELLPLGSRIRCRLHKENLDEESLLQFLEYMLDQAGNRALMTENLKNALVGHCAGNIRALTNMANEILNIAMIQEQTQLTEKMFFDLLGNGPVHRAHKN